MSLLHSEGGRAESSEMLTTCVLPYLFTRSWSVTQHYKLKGHAHAFALGL